MLTKDDVIRLRTQSGDSAVFNNLMQNDPKFKSGVDNVRSQNPNMGGFEQAKLPSAMIDLYYGIKSGTPEPTTSSMMVNATRGTTPKEPTGTFGEMIDSPLRFAGQTLMNVPRSGMQFAGGIASAAMHPIKTAGTIAQAGLGGAVNTLESIAHLAGVKNSEQIFNFESEEVASAIGDIYVKRYGSLDAAANTLREDPVGFMSDLATVVAGVGGVVRGGATIAGMATGAATRTATQLTRTGRMIRGAQAAGDAMINVGIKMEPIVIAGKGVFMAGRTVRNVASASTNAEGLIHSALKLQPNFMRKFSEPSMGNGMTPAGYILQKGINGSRDGIMDDLEKIWRVSKDTVDSELATVKQTYDLLDDVPQVYNALTEIQDTARKFGLTEELGFVDDFFKKERVTLSDINTIQRQLSKTNRIFKKSLDAGGVGAATRIERLYDTIKTFIEDTAESKGLQDIRLLNKDTQLSYALVKNMERSAMGKFGNNIVSLGDFMTGGIGAAFSGGDPLITAGVVIGRRLLGSVYFKTTFAKYLNKLSADELGKMMNVMATGKHTKETIKLTRKVVAQTAEDMKQKRIGQVEDAYGASLKADISQDSATMQGRIQQSHNHSQKEQRV